jgi:hypothetical protein
MDLAETLYGCFDTVAFFTCLCLCDWLRDGRSGDRIPVGARCSAPVQTALGDHSASCTMNTGSFLGLKSGRGVTLTTHHFLVPWSRKSRTIPLLSLWAVRPVQSLSACCTWVHFTLPFTAIGITTWWINEIVRSERSRPQLRVMKWCMVQCTCPCAVCRQHTDRYTGHKYK